MGYGETYLMAWNSWARKMSREEFVEYFKKHLPIPHDWLHWVADCCGHSVTEDMFVGESEFKSIHWLEEQGLAKFSEFKKWYDDNWDAPKYTREFIQEANRLIK